MNLETYECTEELYLARGDEVNLRRPVMTGDVFADVVIAGMDARDLGIILTHPCSMRNGATLAEHVLVARVLPSAQPLSPSAWPKGHFALMPLPELLPGTALHVGHLAEIGRSETTGLVRGKRLACLSPRGINLLHQRMVFNMTRLRVPTWQLQESIAHVLNEAELLEEWSDELCDAGVREDEANRIFHDYMGECVSGNSTRRDMLRDPQLRSEARRACRQKARELAAAVE